MPLLDDAPAGDLRPGYIIEWDSADDIIPEPSTIALLAIGVLGLVALVVWRGVLVAGYQ